MTRTGPYGTLPRVPNAPRTPLRSFRIPDELYAEAQEIAAEEGETVTDAVRRGLERYVKQCRRKRAKREASSDEDV